MVSFAVTAARQSSNPGRRLLLVMLILACSQSLNAVACEKSLRWDDDPPFSMQSIDGRVVGIDVEFSLLVLAELNCQANLRKLPWARALRELEAGRLDILPSAFPRPQRQAYAYFSGPVFPAARNILFMHQEALALWPISRLLELKNTSFRLGAQINVHYGPDYHQLMSDPTFAAQVSMVTNRSNLWSMLYRRRIDGVIADEYTGAYELQQLGLSEQIKATEIVVSSAAAEVAFSKASNDPAFVEAYINVLRRRVEDGSYARIVERYVRP